MLVGEGPVKEMMMIQLKAYFSNQKKNSGI